VAGVSERAEVQGGVVVGFDGSAPSEKALVWAAQDCDRRGCQLHVLRAWTVSSATRPDSWSPSYVPSLTEFEAAVRADTTRRVEDALRDHPDVEWSVHPVYGQAAKALVMASGQADLLVVGHRGGGGIAGLIIGSVGEHCVRNARCPVVVVQANAEV
jgi:nucleotide-binding universal stress UspA family protein